MDAPGNQSILIHEWNWYSRLNSYNYSQVMSTKNVIMFIVIHKLCSLKCHHFDSHSQSYVNWKCHCNCWFSNWICDFHFYFDLFDLWSIHEQFLIVLIFVHDFLAWSFCDFHATKGCYLQPIMMIAPCGMDEARLNYHQNPNSFHIVYAIRPWPMKINQIFKTWWFF
jgi:hypothetical protein